MSETIIKTALEELVRKHSLAVEELTEQQLAEVIRQAIACGDIQRHVSKRATISAFKTDPQAVLYIPYAREQELETRITELESQLEATVKGSFDASQVMAKENAWLREANTTANKLIESQANENDKAVSSLNAELKRYKLALERIYEGGVLHSGAGAAWVKCGIKQAIAKEALQQACPPK